MLKYISDEQDGEVIETGSRDLYGDMICIRNTNGYGGCDIQIEGSIMTWEQLDELKTAIALAERKWRKNPVLY